MDQIIKFYKDEKIIVDIKGYDWNLLSNNLLMKIYLVLNEALNPDTKNDNKLKAKLKSDEIQ